MRRKTASMLPRFFNPAPGSFFLFGPRGTGKSTWLRQACAKALWVDLLLPDVYRRFSAHPERLRELVYGESQRDVVVIDEVQKVPDLLDVVHSLVEEDPRRRFILTGSSARKLRRAGVDLLAGRLALRTLHPFMVAELGDSFDLEQALRRGLLPLVVSAPDPDDAIAGYVALYLQQEVQMEGLVRNIGDFSRFLEAISFSHGSLLNVSNVARECEVPRKTVESHIEILEDLLLSFRLPVFAKRARRAHVSHSKFYYFDAGVFRSVRPKGPLDRPEEIDGSALEGLVAQHLQAHSAYRGNDARLYFWRTRAGSEVDFIVYGSEYFCAIEVKNSARVRPQDLRSLKAFQEDYPEAATCLLYRGTERLQIDTIRCIPCDRFLAALDPSQPLESAIEGSP